MSVVCEFFMGRVFLLMTQAGSSRHLVPSLEHAAIQGPCFCVSCGIAPPSNHTDGCFTSVHFFRCLKESPSLSCGKDILVRVPVVTPNPGWAIIKKILTKTLSMKVKKKRGPQRVPISLPLPQKIQIIFCGV